jgi:ABC-2 type transport system permease protein
MNRFGRYFRLFGAFGRMSLTNEMAFRGNFLVKVLVEVLWLGILLIFYDTLFEHTRDVAGWNAKQYLFFLGCYYTLEGTIETLFLENALEFAELVRTGNLDFHLLKPIDEQFLVSLRKIDWSTAPKVVLGAVLMSTALAWMGWSFNPLDLAGAGRTFDPARVLGAVALFVCGVSLAYSFLLLLTSTSIWLVRNENLMELWWLFSTLMRYPRGIYNSGWGVIIYYLCWYVVPVLLVVNVPADVMVKSVEPENIVLLIAASALMLYLSRCFFFFALRSYTSASS